MKLRELHTGIIYDYFITNTQDLNKTVQAKR